MCAPRWNARKLCWPRSPRGRPREHPFDGGKGDDPLEPPMTALSMEARGDDPLEPPMTAGELHPLSELQALESESIHIIREVAATFAAPVMLFSGGKDSVVMLHLAAKAFWPAPIPFGVLHVDTGHNFPEVLEFRDRAAEFYGATLKVVAVQDYIDDGRLRERP